MSSALLDGLVAACVNSAEGQWYGSGLGLEVAETNLAQRRVVYRYRVTGDEVSCGRLDAGWLATVVDNATDPLICAVGQSTKSLTTSLTVHTADAVLVGAPIEIECRAEQVRPRMVYATATFRDARRRHIVYATGHHTMVLKSDSRL
ncbi:hypothetical protein GGF46_003533 [Coemansia sp. RSA 552]|nr:hypothetical protein GGF46_003533 [Coemansia sp. RSA 552]